MHDETFFLPTFQASFQTVQLTASAEVDTYNPEIYVIEENTVTVSAPPPHGPLRPPQGLCSEPERVPRRRSLNSKCWCLPRQLLVRVLALLGQERWPHERHNTRASPPGRRLLMLTPNRA